MPARTGGASVSQSELTRGPSRPDRCRYEPACAVGSWGGQRPGLAPYVTGTGATDGATAAGGRSCCLSSKRARPKLIALEFAILYPNEVLGTILNRSERDYRRACFMLKGYRIIFQSGQ
jgi:hypothetical protein